jgi:hypothetical protein
MENYIQENIYFDARYPHIKELYKNLYGKILLNTEDNFNDMHIIFSNMEALSYFASSGFVTKDYILLKNLNDLISDFTGKITYNIGEVLDDNDEFFGPRITLIKENKDYRIRLMIIKMFNIPRR